jgi:hypothetical protein
LSLIQEKASVRVVQSTAGFMQRLLLLNSFPMQALQPAMQVEESPHHVQPELTQGVSAMPAHVAVSAAMSSHWVNALRVGVEVVL